MIKAAQKTKIDEVLEQKTKNDENYFNRKYRTVEEKKAPTDDQLDLVRQDNQTPVGPWGYKLKEKWLQEQFVPVNYEDRLKQNLNIKKIKEEAREPINFIFPELAPEQIKYRTLNQKEKEKLLYEEQKELEQRKYWWSGYEGHKEPPKTQQFFERDKLLPEDAKKQILDVYNNLRQVGSRFQAAYKEANELANTDVSFNYSGTYIDIFKRLPQFIERAAQNGIGRVFGINVDKEKRKTKRDGQSNAYNLITFLRSGLNIFNITPLNIESKKEEMKSAISDMEEILKEYEKRKKVLIKLPKLVNDHVITFLRRGDNREFLKWLEIYFPNEKENFFSRSIEQILYGGASNTFNIAALQTMKTYSDIYFKAQQTVGFAMREELERHARNAIIEEIKTETEKRINPKLNNLLELSHNVSIEDLTPLEKFLYSNFKFDLRGILQFSQIVFKSKYTEESYKEEFLSFKKAFLENLREYLNHDKMWSKQTLDETIKSFIRTFAPGGGRIDRNTLDNLKVEEYDKIINNYILTVLLKSLPNFTRSNNYSNKDYTFPNFSGIGTIIRQTGRLNIENTVNLMLKKAPFVPKEFIVSLVKSAFKGTINTSMTALGDLTPQGIFKEISIIEGDWHQIAMKAFLEILKKSNKYTPENFSNYFRKFFKNLSWAVSFFANNYGKFKELTEEEVISVLTTIIRHPDYFERDKDQLEKFIKYIHDSAGNLSKKDLFSIINNSNFINYNRVGISRKLLNCVAVIRNMGGIKGIKEKYNEIILQMQESGFVSKNFDRNVQFILKVFNSGKEVNPAHPQFQKIFETIATVETDLQTIEMSEATSELLKNYQKKDSRLFDLFLTINSTLRFRVLKDKDPRTLRIGIETNCCQRIGGAGEEAAKQSFINPLAGVLILEWLNNDEWKILTQSYFHYVPKDNGYILDNVEYNQKNCADSEVNLEAAYALLAKTIKEKFDVKYFLAGKSYSKIDTSDFKTFRLRGGDPRYFSETGKGGGNYSDFSPGDAIDLLSPKFKLEKELPHLIESTNKKAESLNYMINNFIRITGQ